MQVQTSQMLRVVACRGGWVDMPMKRWEVIHSQQWGGSFWFTCRFLLQRAKTPNCVGDFLFGHRQLLHAVPLRDVWCKVACIPLLEDHAHVMWKCILLRQPSQETSFKACRYCSSSNKYSQKQILCSNFSRSTKLVHSSTCGIGKNKGGLWALGVFKDDILSGLPTCKNFALSLDSPTHTQKKNECLNTKFI